MDPAERQEALLAAGVQPNPLVPLAANWAAPRGWKDGVFKQGAVVLAGDMLLEALDGDAHRGRRERQPLPPPKLAVRDGGAFSVGSSPPTARMECAP